MKTQFAGDLQEMPKATSQQTTALLRLRELLLNGEFSSGERLAEVPLAKQLRVSRTPLRLALVALAHEGLVQEHPTRGYIVRQIKRGDILDSIDIRGMLEGMAARLAVERSESDAAGLAQDVAKLKAIVSVIDTALETIDCDAAKSFSVYITQNQLFHQQILAMAKSSTLTRAFAHITGFPFAAPSGGFVSVQADLVRSRHVLHMGQDQHYAIVEALEQREASRAEALMREHARLARLNLEIALQSHSRSRPIAALRLIYDADADETYRDRSSLKEKELYG